MNPLEVIIVQPEEATPATVIINSIGGILWGLSLWLIWSDANWFDNTIGRVLFVPALLLAFTIGYLTTFFLLIVSIIISVIGLFIGWVFDFPFFKTVIELISKAYISLFN
jgi:hypothetical protein